MATNGKTKLVAIVDDDDLMRSAVQGLLKAVGWPAQAFASAEEFLQSGLQRQTSCLIADIRMPGMSGLELQARLNAVLSNPSPRGEFRPWLGQSSGGFP